MPIEISVNLYSGRPDPTLDLAEAEIEELRRLLEAARREPVRERFQVPQLGYRGFVIENEAREAGLPYRVEISGGLVAIIDERPEPPRRPDEPRIYRDISRLETWLLDRAADRGLADDIAGMGGPRRQEPPPNRA